MEVLEDLPAPSLDGVDFSLTEPAVTSGQKRLAEIEQMLAEDVALAQRPQIRAFVKQMLTERVSNADGSPVITGPAGARKRLSGTWWQVLFRTGMLKAINGDEAWAERIWNTRFGKARQDVQLSGVGGGPIQTQGTMELPSAEEMARRLLRAREIAEKIIGAEAAPAISGIEVSATTTSDGSALPATRSAVGLDVMLAPTQVVAPEAAPRSSPQVGTIPRR